MMNRELQPGGEQSVADLARVDRVGYDPLTESYHAQHDWQRADSVIVTIIETLSAATGDPPEELTPLYSVLDPDALETVLSTDGRPGIRVEFEYDGWSVSVTSCGDIVVQ